MGLKQCDAGIHFYNPDEFEQCPNCNDNVVAKNATNGNDPQDFDIPKTGLISPSDDDRRTKTAEYNTDKPIKGTTPISDGAKTHTITANNTQSDDMLPVAGWLVIIVGAGRGKDFRIIQGENRIGRGSSMEICTDLGIDTDKAISRDAHAIIVYDNHSNEFFIERGRSRNLARVNGKSIRQSQDLVTGDIIEMGNTKFMFVPLCNDTFSW